MKIMYGMGLDALMKRMGTGTTQEQAKAMELLLLDSEYANTEDIPEPDWLEFCFKAKKAERLRIASAYREHTSVDIHGFKIVDSTSIDPLHGHDDLIWVGTLDDGRWLTSDRAREVAAAIISVADSHDKRHNKQTKGDPA